MCILKLNQSSFIPTIADAVALLQLECTLELNAMKQIELEQARELEAKVDAMGGLEECAASKEKTAALSALMKKSDALVLAKVSKKKLNHLKRP